MTDTTHHTDAADLMSAAEIEALDARCGEYGLPVREARRVLKSHKALLRHLDALTALADGDALGRLLHEEAKMPFAWVDVPQGAKERETRAAVALYARGRAAGLAEGAASRQGEVDALRAQVDERIRKHCDDMEFASAQDIERCAELARLTAALADAERHASDVHDMLDEETRKTERLTAELADRDATHAETIEAWREASGADTPGELASLLEGDRRRAEAERDAARLDGAGCAG